MQRIRHHRGSRVIPISDIRTGRVAVNGQSGAAIEIKNSAGTTVIGECHAYLSGAAQRLALKILITFRIATGDNPRTMAARLLLQTLH